jgi:hypothetical protein
MTMNEQHLDTARAVLATASLGDQTFARADPGILTFWAQALGGIDKAAALRAVVAHYIDEHRRIMPSDVIKRVRAEEASVKSYEERHFNAVPDADPDDVPAYLEALRSGRYVNNSPTEYDTERPIRQIIASTLRTMPTTTQGSPE